MMSMVRWGVRARVIVAAVLPMLAMAAVLTVFYTGSRLADLDEAHAARAQALARQLAAASEYAAFAGNLDTLQQLANAVLAESDVAAVSIRDPSGELLVRSARGQHQGSGAPPSTHDSGGLLRVTESILPSNIQLDDAFTLGTADSAQAPHIPTLGTVTVELSLERVKARRNELLRVATVSTLLVLIASLLLSTWLSRGVSGPIRRVAWAVARIGQGRLSERVPELGGGSLRLLADGVNDMAERLEEIHDSMARRIMEATAELRERKEEAEQANLAKSRFLAAASHDLRQPMHALGLFITELSQLSHAPEARHLVQKISASAEAMENLLDSLLDISKLDAGVLHPTIASFPLQPILERISAELRTAAAEKGLRLKVRATEAWGRSDPVLFERILTNLASNAIRYTQRGGVLVACRRRAGKLHVEVRDSGVGIEEHEQEIIFQEFVQLDNAERARDKGLGLGLAIVRRLTDLLGHRLSLRSRPGVGSVFTLEMPAAEADRGAHGAGNERTPGDLAGWRIVLIEDDPLARNGMDSLLSSWGCVVESAASLEELIDVRAPDAPPPQLLISDFRLRSPDNGITAIAAMRARWGADLPAVLISGDTCADTLKLAQDSAIPLLHKPVRPARLRALLHRLYSNH
ncbi:HAMP domain-containing protein [Pseudothauera nasutitermitis]|uniref:histidine kinase n=1 Tax=Pseudothauera nasutitermitis TaxID=2565930 RepID=A0A4S4AVF9_9RHOO|nr:hybrid sensor histidine kinase/response regulator [Pseudothauera nasutitermitis]THF63928.1 HAMP domain-containing protein [Pseudothauera nasutitermitis]